MKDLIMFLIVVIIVTTIFLINGFINNKQEIVEEEIVKDVVLEKVDNINNEEIRGIFISYLEYESHFFNKDETKIDEEIKEMINSLKEYKINTIYLQVRMFSDSIYKSNIFPFTNIFKQIDALDIFIKYAKKSNIKIYAWINPYRISFNTDISKINSDNPAYSYLNTNHVKVIENKGIYYNPASDVVKNLIVSGITEIVENYDIAGIIFDDYFYPDKTIDLENYEKVKDTISLDDYRLEQVNDLIRKVYKEIKRINKNVEFGISPNGNIENNYDYIYADVKRWMMEKDYIDFIMPQVYYGFYNESKPFIKTVNEWNDLIKNDIKMIVSLALYKSGSIDEYAKSGKTEWIDYNDIISREIEYSRKLSNYKGFSIFRYDDLINNKNGEVDNYLKIN